MNAPLENPGGSARRIGLLALACLLAAFVAFVAHSSQQLPDRVATHFDARGKPNGWMTRAQHVKFTIGLGVGTPVFVLGVFALVTKLNGWGLNIPHKAFWLAPERQQATYDFLQQHSLWLAGLMIIFHGALFESIAIANARQPVLLSSTSALGLIGCFLALLAVWVVVLFLRFRRPVE